MPSVRKICRYASLVYCQAADDAQAIMSLPGNLLGSCATQRPSVAVQRLQDEADFVQKHHGSLPAASIF
jgi:hypothetical protein